jgi:hypothetical protein
MLLWMKAYELPTWKAELHVCDYMPVWEHCVTKDV